LFVGDQDDALIRYAHNLNYPLVLVDHRFGGGRFDSVAINNVDGARKAVEYLISLGHSRIGFVGGSLRSPSFEERLSGYREALAAHQIPFDESLVQVGASYAGRENMLNLLNLSETPTAVFVCNDVNAAKAIKAINERNFKVPDDISVVGFDDSFRASECWPQLTTMRADAEVMGRMAVRRLVKRVAKEAAVPEQIFMDAELVIRGSTGFPKPGRRSAGSRKIQQTTGSTQHKEQYHDA
jgi:DNA-binding LacI/PurR family transcriptional regulator